MASKIIEKVDMSADGYGRAVAKITFVHSLSESDNRPEFNAGSRMGNLRKRGRAEIVKFITEREQKTGESIEHATRRINASLGPIEILDVDLDSLNRWWGISFREVIPDKE